MLVNGFQTKLGTVDECMHLCALKEECLVGVYLVDEGYSEMDDQKVFIIAKNLCIMLDVPINKYFMLLMVIQVCY